MSPVERVARAICEALGVDPDAPNPLDLSHKGLTMWRHHVPAAVAALEEIREPTEEMIKALWPGEEGIHALRFADKKHVAVDGWRLMIDAAVAES